MFIDIFAAPEVGGSPGRSWEEGRALGDARGEGGRATGPTGNVGISLVKMWIS